MCGGLAVAEQPDVGADAGIVKDLLRQGDDGLQPVVFHDPAADLRLARACAAGEERGAIHDDADVALRVLRIVHPGDEVLEKEHLPIRLTRQPGAEAPVEPARGLGGDSLEILAPLVAVGWIDELEVEALVRKLVIGKGATELDVFRILSLWLQNQHV